MTTSGSQSLDNNPAAFPSSYFKAHARLIARIHLDGWLPCDAHLAAFGQAIEEDVAANPPTRPTAINQLDEARAILGDMVRAWLELYQPDADPEDG